MDRIEQNYTVHSFDFTMTVNLLSVAKRTMSRTGLSLDLRTAFRFGTWNVLSLGEQGCDLLVVRELSRLHLSITALTEVRWPGSGTKTVANSTMLWSGRSDNKRMEGVALALDPSASRALISWRPISERLLTATSMPTKTNSTTPLQTSLPPLRDMTSLSFSAT